MNCVAACHWWVVIWSALAAYRIANRRRTAQASKHRLYSFILNNSLCVSTNLERRLYLKSCQEVHLNRLDYKQHSNPFCAQLYILTKHVAHEIASSLPDVDGHSSCVSMRAPSYRTTCDKWRRCVPSAWIWNARLHISNMQCVCDK